MKNSACPMEQKKQWMDSKEFWRLRWLEERNEAIKNELTREEDLKNACPLCHMIRSVWEVAKEECDGCGYSKKEGV